MLFLDPRLSVDGTISCNSCHNLMGTGTDNRPNSVGVGGQHGGRTAPSVWNATLYGALFWDGRASSLEEQAKGPMVNPIEMGNPNHDAVVARLKTIPGYVDAFKAVYGDQSDISIDHVVDAISIFERSLALANSPYDRFLAGDMQAITDAAKRGAILVDQIGCTGCHSGKNFNGSQTAGMAYYEKFPLIRGTDYETKYHLADDLGRYKADDPKRNDPSFRNMWRVPSWRNVAIAAPYFHNGSVQTLDEAVRVMAKTQLGTYVSDAQVGDIVAFLTSLSNNIPAQVMPRLPSTTGTTLFPAVISNR